MSIVNVFVNSRRAVMLTDESLYRPDGVVIGFENKAAWVDSWNGAISGRGNLWGTVTALAIAEAYASFDEFLSRSGAILEREHKAALARGDLQGQSHIEVHVIGWSEREDRAKAYELRSPSPFDTDPIDRPPYVWRDLEAGEDGAFYTQLTPLEYWRLHRQGAEPHEDFTAETFDPIRHGIPLIEAQRRMPADPRTGVYDGMHVIGGRLWLTIVDREGVEQEVIHSWPDEIGKPIRPAPVDESRLPKVPPSFCRSWSFERFDRALKGGAIDPVTLKLDHGKLSRIEASPTPGAGLSRQQRRALAAAAKKEPTRV